MGAFGGLTLTNKGKTLLSKAQAGETLNYTKISVGDGELGSSSILELNDLKNEVMALDIATLKVVNNNRAIVGAVLSNQDITSGFYFREIGVFATDPDQGEILYCYANSGALAEYIPSGGEDIIEKTLDVQMITNNATNITANIDSSLVYASIDQLNSVEDSIVEVNNRVGQNSGLNTIETSTIVGAVNEVDQRGKTHHADYVKHPGFGTASGTANNYTVTLDPEPTAYAEGMGVVVAINSDATGASTLDVNGLGAVPLKKANGKDATNLKQNGIYTFRYHDDGTNQSFILQGEGGEGTATTPQVLEGETFTNDEGVQTGSMTNQGAYDVTPGETNKAIPQGYHDGQGIVSGDSGLLPGNIRDGVTLFGVTGVYSVSTDAYIYDYGQSGFKEATYDSSVTNTGTVSFHSTSIELYAGHSSDSEVAAIVSHSSYNFSGVNTLNIQINVDAANDEGVKQAFLVKSAGDYPYDVGDEVSLGTLKDGGNYLDVSNVDGFYHILIWARDNATFETRRQIFYVNRVRIY